MSAHTRRRRLALAGLGLTLVMSAVVPIATRALGPLAGYMTVMVLYWVGFCVPVAVVFGDGPYRVRVALDRSPTWIAATAIALPTLVFIAANSAHSAAAEPGMVALALLTAVINGPLEELAWRRTFRANSGDELAYEVLGLSLFTVWHVPLFFSDGVVFAYGFAGLVGGSLALGAVWMVMTRRSDSVGWPIVSHALVNAAAFLPFFATGFPE